MTGVSFRIYPPLLLPLHPCAHPARQRSHLNLSLSVSLSLSLQKEETSKSHQQNPHPSSINSRRLSPPIHQPTLTAESDRPAADSDQIPPPPLRSDSGAPAIAIRIPAPPPLQDSGDPPSAAPIIPPRYPRRGWIAARGGKDRRAAAEGRREDARPVAEKRPIRQCFGHARRLRIRVLSWNLVQAPGRRHLRSAPEGIGPDRSAPVRSIF